MKSTLFKCATLCICLIANSFFLLLHAQQNDEANQALSRVDKLYFIENKGQWHSDVLYLARLGGLDAWITKYGVNYTFFKLKEIPGSSTERGMHLPDKFEHKDYNMIGHRVLMELQGHNSNPAKEGKQKQEGYYNYFIGNDDSKHATYVGLYKEALVKNVYNGIDLRYYFDKGSLRYDYIVHAGADPSQIRFTLPGSDKTYINSNGNLVFTTRFGEVSMAELYVYQGKDKKAINASFVKKENNTWAFNLSNYDRSQDLIIDPLIYSTYIGGSNFDEGHGIFVDGSGNAYVTGWTGSTDYDITPGAFQTTNGGNYDVFVTKLNASGDSLVYSTYIGGSGDDRGYSIYVDGSGNAYVTGWTSSTDYHITPGAFQTTKDISYDVFVTKLNATGTGLVYSTYIGGSGGEYGEGIFVDGSGNAYVTGETSSTNYDITPGAFQTNNGGSIDAFVTKLNATGTALVYSTYIGGGSFDYGRGIFVDSSGNAYVTGGTFSPNYDITPGAFQATFGGGLYDVFVTKLNATGTGLVYSTYIGGSDSDYGKGIFVDGIGNAYVTGYTISPDYDITPGAFQTTIGGNANAFVTKLNATGTALVYSTFIGGSGGDYGEGIFVDGSGNAYVTGWTSSTDYHITSGAFQTTYGGYIDAFVTKLNATGTGLVYSTYIGGNSEDRGYGIFVDGSGNAYVTGYTISPDYDITPGAFQTTNGGSYDVFVTKLCPEGIGLSSASGTDNQTVCINTAINSITYNTTGATGANFSGLPSGVTVSYSSGNITISGTPTAIGTFNYTITLTGGCGNVTATGTITVNPINTIALSSATGTDNQTLCINNAITNITYSATGATGANVTGLPSGVTGNYSGGVVTISGTPTVSGTFNYTVTLTGGCGNASATGTITVNPDNTIALSSATGTNNQTVCVNTSITNITYSTTGATGANVTGLPAGVMDNFSGGVLTISGTPTVSGTFNYTVTLTGGCGNASATGTIIVNPANTIALSSAIGTDNQTLCINNAITNITYSTTGATGATVTGLPAGVTDSFSGGVLTISGIPSDSGTFNYTVTLTGVCGNASATGTITVNPDNTISLSSAYGNDNQTLCINTAITNITYNTTGATGASVSGLPAGVTGNFSGGTVTISGTPTVSGTFNYTVTLTGGCGNASTTGTITVNPDNTIALSSANGTNNQTLCINTAITNITYSTSGATGATVSGLPSGVTDSFSGGVLTISGIPSDSGTFNYIVTLTGGCGNATATGTITVNPDNTIALSSANGTDNQTLCINNTITNITYSTTGATGATVSGLPSGVTDSFSGGVLTISGTPTVSGTFNYMVTLTGGCGNASATGTITVNPDNTIALSSATGTDNQTLCINNAITNITYSTTGATGATVSGLPSGVTDSFSGGVLTISGVPSDSGTFNYTVTLIGGSCNASISGTIVVNTCVGIEEQDAANTWHMYPNPAAQQVTIANTEPGTRISILDMTGKVAHAETANSSNHTVNIHHLADGIYMIQLENNGYISPKKLVVNK